MTYLVTKSTHASSDGLLNNVQAGDFCQQAFFLTRCLVTYLYIRPLTIVLVGEGSDMFGGGRLRLGRTVVEADEGVGYERPLLSLATRVATSIDIEGGAMNGGAGSGCCRSCTSDIAFRKGSLAFPAKDIVGKRLPNL